MNKMTTVESWDYYTWEEQQEKLEKCNLEENMGKFLEAAIAIDTAWGTTYIYIHHRIGFLGCKSYLLSYLLQRCGLKNIKVSKEQLDLIETNEYKYKEIENALKEIMKHPEWIKDFKEETKSNKTLTDFTFNMTYEQLRRYY